MSCLHLLTNSQLPDDFTTLSAKDEVVLLSEGVYLSIRDSEKALQGVAACYVIMADLKMRGLPEDPIKYQIIEHKELVDLVFKHDKSITWS